MQRRRTTVAVSVVGLLAAAAALALLVGRGGAAQPGKVVQGRITSQLQTAGCTSAVGICTAGRFTDSGEFNTTGDGELADLCEITGGSESYAGASGYLQIHGTFTAAAGGDNEYVGRLVTP